MANLYFCIFRTHHSHFLLILSGTFQVLFYIILCILIHIMQLMWSGGWKDTEPRGVRKGKVWCWGFRCLWNHPMSVECSSRHSGRNELQRERNERWICSVNVLSSLWGKMLWVWHFLVLWVLVASSSGNTLETSWCSVKLQLPLE